MPCPKPLDYTTRDHMNAPPLPSQVRRIRSAGPLACAAVVAFLVACSREGPLEVPAEAPAAVAPGEQAAGSSDRLFGIMFRDNSRQQILRSLQA